MLPNYCLLFSTISDTIVGLVITQFNYIHNKSLPVILTIYNTNSANLNLVLQQSNIIITYYYIMMCKY